MLTSPKLTCWQDCSLRVIFLSNVIILYDLGKKCVAIGRTCTASGCSTMRRGRTRNRLSTSTLPSASDQASEYGTEHRKYFLLLLLRVFFIGTSRSSRTLVGASGPTTRFLCLGSIPPPSPTSSSTTSSVRYRTLFLCYDHKTELYFNRQGSVRLRPVADLLVAGDAAVSTHERRLCRSSGVVQRTFATISFTNRLFFILCVREGHI